MLPAHAGQGERWGDVSQKPGGGARGHSPQQFQHGGPGGGGPGGPPQHGPAERWTGQGQQGGGDRGGSDRWTSGAGGGQADRQQRWGPQGEGSLEASCTAA